jgi:hypothetical protein
LLIYVHAAAKTSRFRRKSAPALAQPAPTAFPARPVRSAAVTGTVAMALACIGGRRKGSGPGEVAGGTPVPRTGGTLDYG